MVKPSTIKFILKMLRLAQVALLVGIAWTVVSTVRPNPVEVHDTAAEMIAEADEVIPNDVEQSTLKPLKWYEPLWNRDLRQPPIPPVTTPKPAATPKPIPMPRLPRLMGTFVEGDTAWAHLLSAEVGVRVLQLHQLIDDFKISAIEPGRVQLTWREQTRWLEIERPKSVIAQ